jgi:hypothetical protein
VGPSSPEGAQLTVRGGGFLLSRVLLLAILLVMYVIVLDSSTTLKSIGVNAAKFCGSYLATAPRPVSQPITHWYPPTNPQKLQSPTVYVVRTLVVIINPLCSTQNIGSGKLSKQARHLARSRNILAQEIAAGHQDP